MVIIIRRYPSQAANNCCHSVSADERYLLNVCRLLRCRSSEDPGEQRNIASERDDLLDLMQQKVQAHLESVGSFPSYRPTPTELSEEDIEKLRSLGYVR